MKTEVTAAANFVTSLLRMTGHLTEHQLFRFSLSLQQELLGIVRFPDDINRGDREHYQHHWFPQAPCRGSGYRCLRINHKMDPLIGKAACSTGLTREQISSMLPRELTLWVDPNEVSCRIGENGSTCILYKSSPPGGSLEVVKNPAAREDRD